MLPWRTHVIWEMELARAIQDPFNFIFTFRPGVSLSPVSPRAVVPCSSLGLSISTFSKGSFSSFNQLSASRPGYPVLPMIRGFTFGGLSLCPINMIRSKGWDHLRANPDLGYSGSSLPFWLSLSSANLFLGRIFPCLYMG